MYPSPGKTAGAHISLFSIIFSSSHFHRRAPTLQECIALRRKRGAAKCGPSNERSVEVRFQPFVTSKVRYVGGLWVECSIRHQRNGLYVERAIQQWAMRRKCDPSEWQFVEARCVAWAIRRSAIQHTAYANTRANYFYETEAGRYSQ